MEQLHVLVLANHHDLLSYLLAWGYDQDVAIKTLQEIRPLAELTDHHFSLTHR